MAQIGKAVFMYAQDHDERIYDLDLLGRVERVAGCPF